jgi:hypothetical protein
MLNDNENKERSEEEVVGLDKVAGPDMGNMVLQECRPGLTGRRRIVTPIHVLLNGSFADADAQLEQFATNSFCDPGQVLGRHLPNQINGLL